MKKSKKGQTAEKVMIVLILALLFFVVFQVFEGKLFAMEKKQEVKERCSASVRLYQQAKIEGMPFIDEINCPTEKLQIKETDKKKINREIARAMYDCYGQFGRGEYELFTGNEMQNYCIVCHLITFDSKVRDKKITIPADEFVSYLKNAKIDGNDMTYEAFFSGYKSDRDSGSENDMFEEIRPRIETAQYDINTQLEYATVFTYLRKGQTTKFLGTGIGATKGFAYGAAIGIITYLTGGTALIIGSFIGLGGITGGIIGYTAGHEKSQIWESGIILLPYQSDELKKLGCTELPAKQIETLA